MLDPVALAAELIKCPSVTPRDAGALDALQTVLEGLGFVCTRLPFESEDSARVDNVYAQLGTGAPHFCFAGHTDVVAAGDESAWQYAPFAGTIADGNLIGRGAVDMKGAIAAFVGAVARFCNAHNTPNGTISLLITGDEEGVAINGTAKVLQWIKEQGITIDDCLVGEPTNPQQLGDAIKIGRRGSLNGTVRVNGTQGHVAYPHLAENPAPLCIALMQSLAQLKLDDGTAHFQPSNLEITRLHIDNDAVNVIPATASGRFNIRYNDVWTRDTLRAHIETTLAQAHETYGGAADYALDWSPSGGDCFLSPPSPLVDMLRTSIAEVTERTPELSTSGGTSDARFIKDYARVVEFGLVGRTMHKVNESTPLADIEALTEIYTRVLTAYFSASGG